MELKVRSLQPPVQHHQSDTMTWGPSYSLVVERDGIEYWVFVSELTVDKIKLAVEEEIEKRHKNKMLIDEINRMLKEEGTDVSSMPNV